VVGVSRRRFLGLAGALGGALLAGCGRDDARREPEPDAAVLADLLAREQATVAAGAAAGGSAIVRAVRAQDAVHARRLRAAIAAAGGVTGASAAAGGATGAGGATALAASAQRGVFAYVEALPRLADPDLRVLVMRIAASEAGHIAALRLAAGSEPVPDAFAGFGPEAP
jgi:hypothetical protein